MNPYEQLGVVAANQLAGDSQGCNYRRVKPTRKTTPNRKLSDFRQQSQNLNRHTERGMGMLDESMREVGYAAPMVAAADGEILDGSARHETAANVFGPDAEPIVVESDGKRPIVVVRTDIKDAKSKMAKRLAAYANRTGQVNLEWDAQAIAESLGEDAHLLQGILDADALNDLIEQETTIEPIKVQKLPTMAWVLVGVPIEQFGQVQAMLDHLPQFATVLTTVNDNEDQKNGQSQPKG